MQQLTMANGRLVIENKQLMELLKKQYVQVNTSSTTVGCRKFTNWGTIQKRIASFERNQTRRRWNFRSSFPKKEVALLNKQRARLEKRGIEDMPRILQMCYVFIKINRCRAGNKSKLYGWHNTDPDDIDVIIPANDDVLVRAVKLIRLNWLTLSSADVKVKMQQQLKQNLQFQKLKQIHRRNRWSCRRRQQRLIHINSNYLGGSLACLLFLENIGTKMAEITAKLVKSCVKIWCWCYERQKSACRNDAYIEKAIESSFLVARHTADRVTQKVWLVLVLTVMLQQRLK